MRFKTVFLLPLLGFLALPPLEAEQIRGIPRVDTTLSVAAGESGTFSLSLEELAVLRLPDTFEELITGIEIEVRIPREAETYMDGFACLVYGSVEPEPSEEVRFYRGNQVGYASMPSRGRLYIRIPVGPGEGDRPSPGTIVFEGLENTAPFPLVLTLLPFMKGIPDGVYDIAFPVKVYTIIKNRGMFELDIRNAEGNPVESLGLFLDDKPLGYPPESPVLAPGLHSLRAEAPGYRTENRTFSVEKGSLSRVAFVMEKNIPTVLFEAPRGSSLFFDGQQLEPPFDSQREIEPGEHMVLYTIGDYTISRKFTAEAGGRYKIELFLDISVENY